MYLDTHAIEINGKEFLALEPDQVICYEGSAKVTVLAGSVTINGCQLSCEHRSACIVHSPSGFPCHAIRSAKKPLLFTQCKPPLLSQWQKEIKHVAKRSSLNLDGCRTLIQFLRKLTKEEESTVAILQLEEHCDDVNRLLSGTCGLGQFFSRDSSQSQSSAGSDVDGADVAESRSASADDAQDESTVAPTSHRLWPGFVLRTPGSCSGFTVHSQWKQTIKSIVSASGRTSAMICGGMNVGKSSFGRLLVNSLLNRHDRVVFIETDVGQTELSAPAMLSLHCLTQPLIGPPFCHQSPAVMSIFFGDVSPSNQPDFYVRCVCRLMEVYLEKFAGDDVPLVVNTHGWVRGLGITLIREVYRLVRPGHLVVFKSAEGSKLMPANWLDGVSDNVVLNTDSVASTSTDVPMDGSSVSEGHSQDASTARNDDEDDIPVIDLTVEQRPSPVRDSRECQLYHVRSHEATDRTRSIQSKTHRHLAVVASLAATLQQSSLYESELSSPLPVHASALLRAVPPRELPWSRLALHVMHSSVPRSQILHAMNGSLVALAYAEDTSQFVNVGGDSFADAPCFLTSNPVVHCLGLAVIRAVDMTRKSFHICTSFSDEELQRVNIVLKGRLDLSTSFLHESASQHPVPYMSRDFSKNITGAGVSKPRKNLKRR